MGPGPPRSNVTVSIWGWSPCSHATCGWKPVVSLNKIKVLLSVAIDRNQLLFGLFTCIKDFVNTHLVCGVPLPFGRSKHHIRLPPLYCSPQAGHHGTGGQHKDRRNILSIPRMKVPYLVESLAQRCIKDCDAVHRLLPKLAVITYSVATYGLRTNHR